MDPLDIVLRGNHALDPTSRKAMRVPMAKILDGQWKSAAEGKERRDIVGNRQKDLNLEDENMIYVTSFGAAIVARKRIDKPKPLICNAHRRKCMEARDRLFRGAIIEGKKVSRGNREKDEL